MPNYNYHCKSCNHDFDDMFSIAERHTPETLPCPNCKDKCVELQMTAPSICTASRMDVTKSSKPQGDFRERMQQIKKHFKRDKHTNIPDF